MPDRRGYPAIHLGGAHFAIAGGAQGIGRATAEAFAALGARVAIGDLAVLVNVAKRAALS